MFGFHNKLLRVNLSSKTSAVEVIPDGVLARYLGGKGLGAYLLLKEVPQGVDPFSPSNPLIFTVGPVTSAAIPGSTRYGVFAKSPLTGGFAESYSGGATAPHIQRAGFDAIVIQGASDSPVYLEIADGDVRFHAAEHLWGKDTYETEDAVLDECGKKGAQAVVIGPAGENLVRFACIENNRWRSAGRTGMGAVMGSKRLKAIVFSGSRPAAVASPRAVKEIVAELREKGRTDPGVAAYKKYGTPMMVATNNKAGSFPTRYWSAGSIEGWEKISGEAMLETLHSKPRACPGCFFACGKLSKVTGGMYAGLEIEGPEYETLYAFGGLCEILDLPAIAYLNDLCDRLGMDTITAGNMVAFAMEAGARGRLEAPAYGDADGAVELLQMIAERKGIGNLLAEGIVPASRALGLQDIAIHVKGMEPAGYDPRILKGMGLAYATSSRGACHLRATFYKVEFSGMMDKDAIEGKAALFVDWENRLATLDLLIMCRFYRDLLTWEKLPPLIEATTGRSYTVDDLREMANQVVSLTRAFNYREGQTKADDNLPARFHDEPLNGKVISREQLETMLQDYYRVRGWDAAGRPSSITTKMES